MFPSDSMRAWQGALSHPGAGRGPRVSAAAQGPSDAPCPVRTLQAAQGTGIPSMSWPGGCLGGTSVPSGTVVVSLDGAGAPTRVWVLRPLPPLFTVGVPSLLSPDICPCCFSELRSLWCKPGLWPRQGGQQLPGMARAVRSAGASASMLTGLPGQVGPADTQRVGSCPPRTLLLVCMVYSLGPFGRT